MVRLNFEVEQNADFRIWITGNPYKKLLHLLGNTEIKRQLATFSCPKVFQESNIEQNLIRI